MDRRKAGILLACLLGLVLLLYLGGLLDQLLYNYEEWMRQDGMTGGLLMVEISASPLDCVSGAFTASGLKGTLLILLGIGGVILYVKLHDKFGNKEYDARNFTRSKSGAYGTAGWMEPKEVKTVFEIAPPDKAQGTILGELNGQAVCLPVDTKLNRHLLIFGASGTMKSRAVIRPYLIQSVKRQESVIVTDSKSELYNDMAGYFIDNGYEVKVFNLVDPHHSDSWNCMADLQQDTLLAQVLSDVIISNTSGERGDHFWDNGEANLLKALVLYVDHTTAFGAERRNLPEVYRFLTQTNERQLSALFDKLPVEHPARAPYNLFRQSSDTVRSGILLGLGTRLQTLQSEQVKRILSRSDIDLTAPAKRKCAYFVILDDQNSTMNFLSSLFFSFLFIRLTRLADSSPGGRCPIPVNFVLDEFANIGTIGGNNGRDFARSAATLRSRAVSLVLALQSLPQLQNRYGNNLWAEILGCCDTQLMLGCSDDVTATYVSTRSGDMTIDVNSTMTTRQTFAVAQVIPQYRYSEGLGKRRLLTPDEVMRLPHDDMLVALRGQKILRLKKLDYTRLAAAKQLRPCSILDYQASVYSEPMSQPYAVQPQYTPLTPSVGDLYESDPTRKLLIGGNKSMPKKTSETETVETMNMELSTPGTAEDTAVSMTENENSEIALGSAEEIVEKPDETVSPTTETAEADIAPGDGVEAIDSIPSPTTETEEAANLPQAPEDRPENTAAEPVVQETPEPKPKRSRRSASKPEPESVIQVTPSPQSDEPAADTPVLETSPTRRPRRRAVVSLDGQRSELTPEARRRQDIIDLSESMKSRRVITGTIAGIEHMDESPDLAYAVVYHGAFKVIIPASEMFEFDEDAADNYRGATLSRRLGAEIDYVVKGIETDAGVAAGSRLEAMRQRRREYYLDTDRNGHHQLEAGDIAEARVVSVIRPGAFVELFGIEQFIPLEELSYLRWVDATTHFRVGDRVLVKILELDRSDRNNISLKLSVKQAGEDAFKQAISRFKVGNIYVGNVTMITAVGVFVSFENVSCLCQFPKRKRPAIGSPVTVRILGADLERLRLWGAIVYS